MDTKQDRPDPIKLLLDRNRGRMTRDPRRLAAIGRVTGSSGARTARLADKLPPGMEDRGKALKAVAHQLLNAELENKAGRLVSGLQEQRMFPMDLKDQRRLSAEVLERVIREHEKGMNLYATRRSY